MKNAFRWLAAGFVTASLLVTAQAAPGDGDWDHARMEPLFSANPDLATCLAPGAVAMSLPFGIMRLEVSVLAVWVATTVYSTVSVSSPISDSSTLPTHMIGIRTTTMDTPTIIPIMTTVRFLVTGIRAISSCWCKVNLPGVAITTDRLMA